MINQDLMNIIFWAGALLISVSLHEFMHAWTADYLGDKTARLEGRVTLNPLAHLDPLGTLALVFLHFGWGKPVPVNPNNFKNPKLGWALVSLAGPLSNFVLAAVLGIVFKFFKVGITFNTFLLVLIVLNIRLLIFNLIPIPPLDGSRVLYALLPNKVNLSRLESYGPILLLGLIFFGGGIISGIMGPAVSGMLSALGINSMGY